MSSNVSTVARPLIFLAEAESFRADDLRIALREAHLQTLGPVRTVAEGLALLNTLRDRPDAAIANLRLGNGTAVPLLEAIIARGIPLLLIGEGGMRPPQLLAGHPCLLAPFASCEIVAEVRRLVAHM